MRLALAAIFGATGGLARGGLLDGCAHILKLLQNGLDQSEVNFRIVDCVDCVDCVESKKGEFQRTSSARSCCWAGPRQSGKTTLSKQLGLSTAYLNFDRAEDRSLLMAKEWDRTVALVVFDDLHKMRGWKAWLKGIYDTEGVAPALLVTGSARLETFSRGGDSLAGRFYLHRLHPFTVREVEAEVNAKDTLERILRLGGFPEPLFAQR